MRLLCRLTLLFPMLYCLKTRKARKDMFNCILFDFDGTVFDTVEGITKSVRYALNKVGLDAEL